MMLVVASGMRFLLSCALKYRDCLSNISVIHRIVNRMSRSVQMYRANPIILKSRRGMLTLK